MTAKKATPAQRARARRDPAISEPPRRPVASRTSAIRNLHLRVGGRAYPIGEHIEGDTPWEMTIDGAATVTIPIRSPDDSLLAILGDEAAMQEEGVRLIVDKIVYVLVSVTGDDSGLYTLVFEDEVAWRLRQFTKFKSLSRKTHTRGLFIKWMIDEAARPPRPPLASFIPEAYDKQRILGPKA